MKKKICLLASIFLLLPFAFLFTGCIQDTNNNNNVLEYDYRYQLFQNEDFKYEIINNKISIVQYIGNEKDVIVPNNIDNFPVYEILTGTFKDCNNIESVIFQEGILRIYSDIFSGCDSLMYITYPNSLIQLEEQYYYKLNNLFYNDFEDLSYIGSHNNPYFLFVGNKGTSDGGTTFKNYDEDYINVNQSTKFISSEGFYACNTENNLKIYLPDNLIGGDCTSLMSRHDKIEYNIDPNDPNLLYLGSRNNPYLLLYDVIDKDVETINLNPKTKIISLEISHLYNLKNFNIPASSQLLTINNRAFECCSNIRTILFPNTLLSIGNLCFRSCQISQIDFDNNQFYFNEQSNNRIFDKNNGICLIDLNEQNNDIEIIDENIKWKDENCVLHNIINVNLLKDCYWNEIWESDFAIKVAFINYDRDLIFVLDDDIEVNCGNYWLLLNNNGIS